jgi:hypothetical protein
MKRTVSLILILTAALLALTSIATAGVPGLMNYQGRLTDEEGRPLDDTLLLAFAIYDDSTSGSLIWTEAHDSVIVTEGLFTVLLGSVNPISHTMFADTLRWLQIAIEGEPIVPRIRLISAPFAFRAATVDGATGGVISGDVDIQSDLTVSGKATIGSGHTNTGAYAFVTGYNNTVGGNYSFAAGQRARVGETHHGTFAWADATDADFESSGQNQFLIRASGGVGIGTNSPVGQLHVESTDLYAGYFTSDHLSSGTQVVHSEFTGTGDYDAAAVYGRSTPADSWGYGGYFQGGYQGVYGKVLPTGTDVYLGVNGFVSGGSGLNCGAYGKASDGSSNYGVYGSANGGLARCSIIGIYGRSPACDADYAGYFYGNVHVTGTVNEGALGFKIDHPLDPGNKYLCHSGVESPDMMNVYNGNVILDANGEATVQLPNYFEKVNKDFRYQLTCIGGFAPVYIAERIFDNSFKIAGGKAGLEVSWQVTGIRMDPFAQANRIPVEPDKSAEERGKYLHPQVYGLGEEYGIHYEEHKRLEERLQEKSGQ